MQGLELSRRFYLTHRDALLRPFMPWQEQIAAGLVGFGSDRFGFDDEISQDHDFGPGFCIWLPQKQYDAIGAKLQAAYDALPASFEGHATAPASKRAGKRTGVFAIPEFYATFLGAPALPVSDADWLQIPEYLLGAACNGQVFEDTPGEFSRWRRQIAAYYPERIQRRKLAQSAGRVAQTGQYNLPRSLARKDAVAANLMLAEFIRQSCLLAHALCRRYAPHDKWLHKSLARLPGQQALHAQLAQLAQTAPQDAAPLIAEVSATLLAALVEAGFTEPGSDFLEHHVDALLGTNTETR